MKILTSESIIDRLKQKPISVTRYGLLKNHLRTSKEQESKPLWINLPAFVTA
jgi:hypothetical protein